VLFSSPVCGETSRSARIFNARRTIGNACATGDSAGGETGRPLLLAALAAARRTPDRFS